MERRIDLDAAADEIDRRVAGWRESGLDVGPITWREKAEGWPYPLKTVRSEVREVDSIGIQVKKGEQEGSVVLFDGGWADFLYWSGSPDDEPVDEAPGWEDWLTVERFGALLDRLAGLFR